MPANAYRLHIECLRPIKQHLTCPFASKGAPHVVVYSLRLIVLFCCRSGLTSCTRENSPRASSSLARCTIINGTFISTLTPPLERLHLHPRVLPSCVCVCVKRERVAAGLVVQASPHATL